MPAIFTRGNKVSNFLKKEFWPEEFYCRKSVTVTKAGLSNTVSPGEVVHLDTGKYVACPAALLPGTDELAIIVDSEWDEKLAAATGADVENVAVLVKGPCVLRKGGLVLADETDITDAYTILEAQGFTLADKFSVLNQTLPL